MGRCIVTLSMGAMAEVGREGKSVGERSFWRVERVRARSEEGREAKVLRRVCIKRQQFGSEMDRALGTSLF